MVVVGVWIGVDVGDGVGNGLGVEDGTGVAVAVSGADWGETVVAASDPKLAVSCTTFVSCSVHATRLMVNRAPMEMVRTFGIIKPL